MRITQKGEFRENQKIRVICLIGGIRVKDFPILRKPDARACNGMDTIESV